MISLIISIFLRHLFCSFIYHQYNSNAEVGNTFYPLSSLYSALKLPSEFFGSCPSFFVYNYFFSTVDIAYE